MLTNIKHFLSYLFCVVLEELAFVILKCFIIENPIYDTSEEQQVDYIFLIIMQILSRAAVIVFWFKKFIRDLKY